MTLDEEAVEALEVVEKADPDDAVVEIARSRDRQVRFSRSDVDIVKTWQTEEIDVFAAWDRCIVTTTVKGRDKLPDAVERMAKTARATDPNPMYEGIAEGPFEYQHRRPDGDIEDMDMGEPVHAAIDAAEEAGADVVAGTLYVHDDERGLATTGGCRASERWRALELSVRAFQGEASGHAVTCETRLSDLDPAGIGTRAARFAERAGEPTQGEAGAYRVLFEPLFFATLLDSYAGMAGAFDVQAGLSLFEADDVGDRVAGDAVTLRDDPSRRDGVGHRAFDDEGRPTGEVTVIRDGVLETFLHNTSTARAFDADPTASAGLVAPHPTQIVLEEGDASRDELLEELGDGLWLTNTWYTRYQNRTTGDFSTLPRDACLVVEDGEVAGAVEGLRLSDNLGRLMGNVEAVGDRAEQIKWWAETQTPTFTPHVLAEDVRFTTSR